MIQHVVIYKFKNPSEELFSAVAENFQTIKGNVPGLLRLNCGKDVIRLPRSYDFALYCEFEDMAAYDRYQTAPLHLVVKEFMKTVVEESHSVDWENK